MITRSPEKTDGKPSQNFKGFVEDLYLLCSDHVVELYVLLQVVSRPQYSDQLQTAISSILFLPACMDGQRQFPCRSTAPTPYTSEMLLQHRIWSSLPWKLFMDTSEARQGSTNSKAREHFKNISRGKDLRVQGIHLSVCHASQT